MQESQPPGRVLELPSFKNRNNRPVVRGLVASVLVLAVGVALLSWLFGGYVNIRALIFKEPKIFDIRVDGASIAKNAPPDILGGVVEVPAGATVPVTCETTVSLTEAEFTARWDDTTQPDKGCVFQVPAPAVPGERRRVVITMTSKATGDTIDVKTVVIRAVPAESVVLISHVPPDGQEKDPGPGTDLRVSHRVRVLGKVLLPKVSDADPELRVLVFHGLLEDPAVLQAAIDPVALGEGRLEANAAKLSSYRTFGPKGSGFYYMTPLPVSIGGPRDGARVFRLVAAVVEAKDVDAVLRGHMEVTRLPDGQIRHDVRALTLEEIRRLAWRGLVSEDIRVIRMSPETDPNRAAEAR